MRACRAAVVHLLFLLLVLGEEEGWGEGCQASTATRIK